MDPSLKPDPKQKGSYYRRLEDVARGLESLGTGNASATILVFVYYFGCEKIARGIVGIHHQWPASTAYAHNTRLKLTEVKDATAAIGLQISPQDLDWIFADHNEQKSLPSASAWTNSARVLRNDVTHDFGPTNVARVATHAPFHNPKMETFLASVPAILKYQNLHFAGAA